MTPNDLPFSREEYAGRLDRVRRRMEAAKIDVLLTTVPENIVYLTGYSTLGYFTFQVLVLSSIRNPFSSHARSTSRRRKSIAASA